MNKIIYSLNRHLLLVIILVMSVFPLLLLAQNEGVSGTVDLSVMMAPDITYDREFITISFSSAIDGIVLDLNNWTLHDLTGAGADHLLYTFSGVTLENGDSFTICQTVAAVPVGVTCDDTWGSAFLNNTGDTVTLYDDLGTLVSTLTQTPVDFDTVYDVSAEISYEDIVPPSLTLLFPGEDGLTLNDGMDIEAEYVDADDDIDEFVWYVTSGSCGEDGPVVLGDLSPQTETYDLVDGYFTATVSTETLVNGTYCLVIDPVEDASADDDFYASAEFYIDRFSEPLYKLSGHIYEDVDKNGLYDVGIDQPIKNWQVSATNNDSVLLNESDNDGYYEFFVTPGQWVVTEELKNNWLQTGVIADSESIVLSTNGEVTSCNLTFSVVEESGVTVVKTCDFLNRHAKAGGKKSTGTKVKSVDKPTPTVLGVATSTPVCGRYLQSYLGPNWPNPRTEVMKLQLFLTRFGYFTPLSGVYDQTTMDQVKALQTDHFNEILAPWQQHYQLAALAPTGLVYKTTRAYINNTICADSDTTWRL